MMIRRSVAAVLLALASCGGNVTEPSDATAATSDASDTTPAPSICGLGSCTPGKWCHPDEGCNRIAAGSLDCYCGSTGTWKCTTRYCAETDAPPTCPETVPVKGLPCPTRTFCLYVSACGKEIIAGCSDGKWTVVLPTCP